MLSVTSALYAHHHHGQIGLAVFGAIFVVIGLLVLAFRNPLGRFNQSVQQARHDAAPGAAKALFPTPGPWYYRTVGPAIGAAFVIFGLVLIVIGA